MSPEVYSYSLVVALIGMTTVFAGLALLSVMMVALRRLFKPGRPAVPLHPPKPLKVMSKPRGRDDRWVIAAAVAYLEAEKARRSAARWKPTRVTAADPWLGQRRL